MAATETPVPPVPARRVPARVWLPIGLAVALLAGFAAWVLAGSGSSAPSTNSEGLPILRVGRAAPGFDLARLGGGPSVSLAADRGTPVVINFFASDCVDCRAELRTFAAEARATAGRVDFVGIDTSDPSPGVARSLLARAGATYPVGEDPKGVTASAYSVPDIPATFFVTRAGTVAGQAYGAQSAGALRRRVRRLEQ